MSFQKKTLEGLVHQVTETISAAKKTMSSKDFSQRIVAQQILSNAIPRLNKLKRALTRIDAGDYGKCLSCLKKIACSELEYYPEKERCGNCIKVKAGEN